MTIVVKELSNLKKSKFRPKGWKKIVAELTGFGESYVGKVFNGIRFNKKIALGIISVFCDEKRKLHLEVKLAKITL